MLIVKKASEIPPLSDDDRKQIQEASARPIVDDEDCPQTTDAEFIEFMAKHFDKQHSSLRIR